MGLKNPANQDQKLIVFFILSHLSHLALSYTSALRLPR